MSRNRRFQRSQSLNLDEMKCYDESYGVIRKESLLMNRYEVLQERRGFESRPTIGCKVFVKVNGKEFRGIVLRELSYYTDAIPVNLFAVGIFEEVDGERYPITNESFMTTEEDVLYRMPNGDIGAVMVTLDKMRLRYERKKILRRGIGRLGSTGSLKSGSSARSNEVETAEDPSFSTKLRQLLLDRENAEKTTCDIVALDDKEIGAREELKSLLRNNEKRKVEVESDLKVQNDKSKYLLEKCQKKSDELEASLAAEQKAHQETKRILEKTKEVLTATEQSLEKNSEEKDFISSKQISDEFERELKKEQQTNKELEARIENTELKSIELERKLACEQTNRVDTEHRLQIAEGKVKELETTLAVAQRILKSKRETDKECDWMLQGNEIHLTEEKLGSGAFGTVYKGMFRGAQVAVKQVSLHARITDYNKENFKREMRMAARCRHPQMLQFIGATMDEEMPLLVTELLDTSLKAILQERALETSEFTTLALDVALGLNYLHLKRPNPIVHRDISSGNVLLWKQGQSWRGKISDYGNAVLMNYAKTGSGGAIPYLAPEMDNQKFSTKSDVYSYGVLLLEMYRREEPSLNDDRDELICLVENGKLRELMRGCLQQDPKRRPTVEEILTSLNFLAF